MPNLSTAQEWLTQSTLLLQAYPSSTRITTKYTITSSDPSKSSRRPKFKAKPNPESPQTDSIPAPPTPATLTFKTYCPISGVTLKYTTNKAAEVSRLFNILGKLARPMAGLEMEKEDVVMQDAVGGEGVGRGAGTPAVESVPAVQGGGKVGGGQQQGGKGKGKKKGKK